jgi:hypothetical protein
VVAQAQSQASNYHSKFDSYDDLIVQLLNPSLFGQPKHPGPSNMAELNQAKKLAEDNKLKSSQEQEDAVHALKLAFADGLKDRMTKAKNMCPSELEVK